jgi:hypothetical protein
MTRRKRTKDKQCSRKYYTGNVSVVEDTEWVIRIQRRTDNTMAKRKRIKGQTTIYKTYIYN